MRDRSVARLTRGHAPSPHNRTQETDRHGPATACRLNVHGRALHSWRRADPRYEKAPIRLARRGGAPDYDAAAALAREAGPDAAPLAILDPSASEQAWLEFELAVAAYGLGGGFVDLDEARLRLGPDETRRLTARAAALCARRGVGLLVQTRRRPEACPLRRSCGPRPPCLRLPGKRDPEAAGASPLAPSGRIG
jgi:hypothetical protein